MKNQIISALRNEFGEVEKKFVQTDLLENGRKMDYDYNFLKATNSSVLSNPGVYLFIGNKTVYRVGKSSRNCINRVREHLDAWTQADGYCIWDIADYHDKPILLLNIKDPKDAHWVLSVEAFLETHFEPLIKAKRVG